jgi:hypothetical protein
MACLARLTSWEKTNSPIGDSNKRASILKLCKNTPEKGSSLCQECSGRPESGKYQTRMIHGLLTEPPCDDSHMYGSTWYWERVAKHGDPLDTVWLAGAKEAQAAGEEICLRLGLRPWMVQSPSNRSLEEMRQKKKEKDVAAAAARLTVVEKKGTLLEKFAPIKVIYEESAEPPEKLETDSCKIWKDSLGEIEVWITEFGLVFDTDTTGGIGELMGYMKEGELIGVGEEVK